MPLNKELSLIEAKLDALLEKAGIKPDEIEAASPKGYGGRVARKLTKQEQQAIDNAPATPTADEMQEPVTRRQRTNSATNAPDTSSSVPQMQVAETGEPWQGFDDAPVDDIVAQLRNTDVASRDRALAYERANKNRVGITRVNWNS